LSNNQVALVKQPGRNRKSNNIILPVPNTAVRGQSDVRITQIRAPKISKPPTNGITQCGLDFLKCAFATPDFDSTGSMGIPDNYVGRTCMTSQTYSAPGSAAPGVDSYLLVSPLFGSAVLGSDAVAIGAPPAVFTSTQWPGAANLGLFSPDGGTGTVTKFRYAGLAAEIQCTMNEMTWAGSITCFKIPLTFTVDNSVNPTLGNPYPTWQPNGLSNIQTNPFNNLYTAPFNRGAYSVAFNRNGSFDFKDVVGDSVAPNATRAFVNGATQITMPFRGIDDLDTIVFKITVPPGAPAQSFILRTWACVEMQIVPSSFVYEFTTLSCPYDQIALDLYKLVAERLPIAVPYDDNSDFWKRVFAFIRSASKSLSRMPGTAGLLAGGTNMIMEGLSTLSF